MNKKDITKQFNELTDSIETICKWLHPEQTNFRKTGPRKIWFSYPERWLNTHEFVLEYIQKPGLEFKHSMRDEFDQSSNGYASIKVVYNIDSNIFYIYSKYKGIIKTRNTSSWLHPTEKYADEPEGLREVYKKSNLSPKRVRRIKNYSAVENTNFHYDHYFKCTEKNLKRLNQLFAIFFEYHTEELVKISN